MAVFAILRSLVKKEWAAGGGAFLFAIHPVQVEPVAWITGMKDILAGLLSLGALALYLKYAAASKISSGQTHISAREKKQKKTPASRNPWIYYVTGIVLFILALLAKPSAVVVPVIAGMLDYWMVKRPLRQCARSLLWWVLLAVPFVVLNKWQQPDAGMAFVPSYWARPLVAGDAAAFYLYKLLVPLWLGPDYGRTPASVLQRGWTYVAWVVPVGFVMLSWWWKERWPWLLVSLAIFFAGVLPVLGLIPFEFQRFSTVTDRYLYLSMLGPALALSYLLSQASRRWVSVLLVLTLGLLAIGGAFQIRVWRDSTTLFAHALKVNPWSPMAHNNLGNALTIRGLADEALIHYREALRLKPDYGDPHNNWAVVLLGRGEVDEAIGHFRDALRVDPSYTEAHYNLGNALLKRGELEEAVVHFKEAVRRVPTYLMAHNNLANALARKGDLEEAVEHYESALRIDPTWAEAHYNLGSVLAKKGDWEGAVAHFREAVRFQPKLAQAHDSLARLLIQQGRREEALLHYEEALRILKSQAEKVTSP